MTALFTGSTSLSIVVYQQHRLQQVLVGRYVQVSACLSVCLSLCLPVSLFLLVCFSVLFTVSVWSTFSHNFFCLSTFLVIYLLLFLTYFWLLNQEVVQM